jgi:hypothetical protein
LASAALIHSRDHAPVKARDALSEFRGIAEVAAVIETERLSAMTFANPAGRRQTD